MSEVLVLVVVLAIIVIPIVLIYMFGGALKDKIMGAFNMLKPECTELKAGYDFEQLECTSLKGPGHYCDVTKCKLLKKDGESCLGGLMNASVGSDDCEGRYCLDQSGTTNTLSVGGKCVTPGKTGWGGVSMGNPICGQFKDRDGKIVPCDSTHYCDSLAGPSCQPRKTEGASCGGPINENECADGFFCSSGEGGETGFKCKAKIPIGSTCSAGSDAMCQSGKCGVNLKCIEGGTSVENSTCNPANWSTCSGLPSANCCNAGLYCDGATSTCKKLGAVDTPCTDSRMCLSGACNGSKCVATLAKGACCVGGSTCNNCPGGVGIPDTTTCGGQGGFRCPTDTAATTSHIEPGKCCVGGDTCLKCTGGYPADEVPTSTCVSLRRCPKLGVNEACNDNSWCKTGSCVGGYCQDPNSTLKIKTGGSCWTTSPSLCESGVCNPIIGIVLSGTCA
jgi:hypothetical protein